MTDNDSPIMWSRRNKNECPCFVSDLRGKAFNGLWIIQNNRELSVVGQVKDNIS